jgi:membrane-bound ClpP family serine protease
MRVDSGLIALLVIIIAGFIVFAVWRIVLVHRRQATTGREELKGKTAVVREVLDPEGTVFLEGERWNAVSESGSIASGEEVVITKVDGLKLYVTKKDKEGNK